jgi:hypothetical protein
MNRTQIAIIVSWLIFPIWAVCVISGLRGVAPYALLLFLYCRSTFESKCSINIYFSKRPYLYALTILLLSCSGLWFLYRAISLSGSQENFGLMDFIPFTPIAIIALCYDIWVYRRSVNLPNADFKINEEAEQVSSGNGG